MHVYCLFQHCQDISIAFSSYCFPCHFKAKMSHSRVSMKVDIHSGNTNW